MFRKVSQMRKERGGAERHVRARRALSMDGRQAAPVLLRDPVLLSFDPDHPLTEAESSSGDVDQRSGLGSTESGVGASGLSLPHQVNVSRPELL